MNHIMENSILGGEVPLQYASLEVGFPIETCKHSCTL